MADSKTYSVSKNWKLVLVLEGLALSIAGALGVDYFFTVREVITDAVLPISVSICLSIIVVGMSNLIRALFLKALVVTPQALNVPGLIRDLRIPKAQIAGYRAIPWQLLPALQLNVARPNGSMQKVRVNLPFKPDAVLDSWLADIPDVGAQRQAAL